MRTALVNVLKFDELSYTAKAKARDWFRGTLQDDYEWENKYLVESFAEQLYELGYEAPDDNNKSHWIEWDQYENVSMKNVRDRDIGVIAKRLLSDKQYRRFIRVLHTDDIDVGTSDNMYVALSYHYDGEYPKIDSVLHRLAVAMATELRELGWKFQSQIRASYAYLESDTYIDESIISNGYEFTATGKYWTSVMEVSA